MSSNMAHRPLLSRPTRRRLARLAEFTAALVLFWLWLELAGLPVAIFH